MEMDVNLAQPQSSIEPKTISAQAYANCSNTFVCNQQPQKQKLQQQQQSNNNIASPNRFALPQPLQQPYQQPQQTTNSQRRHTGCCGILSRLLCASVSRAKTASSSNDYNNFDFTLTSTTTGANATTTTHTTTAQQQLNHNSTHSTAYVINTNPAYDGQHHRQREQQHHYQQLFQPTTRKSQTRRTPQEIYFESRGKSCKKLLKFNGSSNKILLYPEEGWARTASSTYWTITPCWWQPNRCRIEEFAGTQRHTTKAKMVSLEQKGSLLIAGHFRSKNNSNNNRNNNSTDTNGSTMKIPTDADEFKLHLSSNITMEDYNMGYCLTGFVERRCQQTNTFQMTHFAVIKRQWPSITAPSCSNKSL